MYLFPIDSSQTSRFSWTKRRRLFGLNSRFDRMLQEVTWASCTSNSIFPRRKHAYSSGSSSMTNRDFPKTPTEAEMDNSFVPSMPANWPSEAMLCRNAHMSPSQVGKAEDMVLSNLSSGQLVGNFYCPILGLRGIPLEVTRVAEQRLGHSAT